MCWNCLQTNHLDLPRNTAGLAAANALLRDERALLAYLDPNYEPYFSWTGFADNAQLPVIVTYRLVEAADLPPIDGGHGETAYFSFSATQRANFRLALEEASQVSGVVFVETDGPAMINAFGSTGSQFGGWANYAQSTGWQTGEGVLVMNDSSSFAPGGTGFHILLHELGHALGLKHPFDGQNVLDPAIDNTNTTVMSYDQTVTRRDFSAMDIAALRHLYGDRIDTTGWAMQVQDGAFVASGSARADAMTAVGLDSRISGLDGSDTLRGRHGADSLFGGNGQDVLEGGYGADRLDGGLGHDRLVGAPADEVVYADADPEAADTLIGGAGNDTLEAGNRKSILYGGDGADLLRASPEADFFDFDLLSGGAGNDTLFGSSRSDTLLGGLGNDRITTGAARTASGEAGHDQLFGGTGLNVLNGGTGNDTLSGGAGEDSLNGDAGDDVCRGGADADLIDGFDGKDRLFGDAGDDWILGGNGYDSLSGGGGRDRLEAEAEGGLLRGGGGDDTLLGGTGGSRLYGEAGNDSLVSGSGSDDLLAGGGGTDTLEGNAGDSLSGGDGADTLYALGGGRLTGGGGADTFCFTVGVDQPVVRVTDLAPGLDRLRVDIGAWDWGNVLDDIRFTATADGSGTRAIVTVQNNADRAEILFLGVTPDQLNPGMFEII